MTVRIRFARLGCKHRPFYRIVVADSKSQRDGKNLEIVGYYDPLSGQDGQKRMSLKFERIKYWLSVGAQPSEPVERILLRSGLLAPPPMVAAGGRKDGSGAKLTGAAEESGKSEDGISPEAVFSIGLQV